MSWWREKSKNQVDLDTHFEVSIEHYSGWSWQVAGDLLAVSLLHSLFAAEEAADGVDQPHLHAQAHLHWRSQGSGGKLHHSHQSKGRAEGGEGGSTESHQEHLGGQPLGWGSP